MSTISATIYINAEQNVELQSEDVYVKDIGSLTCSDAHVLAKVKAIKLHHFKRDEQKRQVISLLKVIEEIEKVYPNVSVQSIGEPETLVEYISVNKHSLSTNIKALLSGSSCFLWRWSASLARHLRSWPFTMISVSTMFSPRCTKW